MSNTLLWYFLNTERMLVQLNLTFFARILAFIVRIVFTAQIPETVCIGRGTVFGYGGLSVVIHKHSKIGANCRIGTGVVLGSKNPDINAPTIEDDVYIGSGAKILGGITIGKGAVIGANAVVTKDIPAKTVAAGIPARIIKKNINPSFYNENFFEE